MFASENVSKIGQEMIAVYFFFFLEIVVLYDYIGKIVDDCTELYIAQLCARVGILLTCEKH